MNLPLAFFLLTITTLSASTYMAFGLAGPLGVIGVISFMLFMGSLNTGVDDDIE